MDVFQRAISSGLSVQDSVTQAINAEPDIGLLLPCNVLVREEEEDSITVAFMDPKAVLGLVEGYDVATLALEVRGRLERVRDLLAAD